jgi:hypothetical protein
MYRFCGFAWCDSDKAGHTCGRFKDHLGPHKCLYCRKESENES